MDKTPKDGKNKYPAPFSIRFTADERKSLKLAADGRPLAAYIRWLIFKEDIPELPRQRIRGDKPDKDRKLLAKLLGVLGQSRIANNINQLAKAAHSGSLPVDEDITKALEEALESVHWMRQTLIKGMGVKPQGENGDSPDDS